MPSISHRLALLALPVLLGSSACLPYTVGTTAQTVPAGRTTSTMSTFFIPNAFKEPGDSVGIPMAGVDREWRHGLDDRSDMGLRLTSGLGAVVNYKRRVQDYSVGRPALSYMVGSGIVNAGEHLHFEATILASGNERGGTTPYGGLRAMQVAPITVGAAKDQPTIGVFGGMQFGDASFTLRPELGVFYDRSTLGLRSSSFIIVPAVTLQRGRRTQSEVGSIGRPALGGTRESTVDRSWPRLLGCLVGFC